VAEFSALCIYFNFYMLQWRWKALCAIAENHLFNNSNSNISGNRCDREILSTVLNSSVYFSQKSNLGSGRIGWTAWIPFGDIWQIFCKRAPHIEFITPWWQQKQWTQRHCSLLSMAGGAVRICSSIQTLAQCRLFFSALHRMTKNAGLHTTLSGIVSAQQLVLVLFWLVQVETFW
jgi:hypothetical protein